MDGHLYVKPFMSQRIVVKIGHHDGVMAKGIHPKFVLLSGMKELSYSEVGYLQRQFAMGWEWAEDARGSQYPESLGGTSTSFRQNPC
jgi:hypothetical protein